jgi:hypothetical protein
MEAPTPIAPQYITDTAGNKLAVVLDLSAYQALLEELDELRCQQGYQEALPETEPEIESGDYLTLDQYLTVKSH